MSDKKEIPCVYIEKGCNQVFTNYPNRRRHSKDRCPFRPKEEEKLEEEEEEDKKESWKNMSLNIKIGGGASVSKAGSADPNTDINIVSNKLIEICEGNINLLKGDNDRCTPNQEKQIKKVLKEHKLLKGENFKNLYMHFNVQELVDEESLEKTKAELDVRISASNLNPQKHALINYARSLPQDELENEIEFGMLYVDLVSFLRDYQKNTNLYAKELIHSMLHEEERENKKRHRSLSNNSNLMSSQNLDDNLDLGQLNREVDEEENIVSNSGSNSSKKTKHSY